MFKLIMRVDVVPDGATVTKIAGTKEYKVRRTLHIYADRPEHRREVACDAGCVFLVDAEGNANVCLGTKEMCWHASEADMREMLQMQYFEDDE
jgi:hypothetical protein